MFTNADEAVWENTAAQTDSPLRVLETKELGERIQKTLDGLPDEYRLLLLLVADEELSYEQVGTLTGQTADAVRGKLHRARKAFAVLFAKTEPESTMKHEPNLTRSSSRNNKAAEHQTHAPGAREFASAEELLRHDAAHTLVPPAIAQTAPAIHRPAPAAQPSVVEAIFRRIRPMKTWFKNFFSSLPLGTRLFLLAYALGFPVAWLGSYPIGSTCINSRCRRRWCGKDRSGAW